MELKPDEKPCSNVYVEAAENEYKCDVAPKAGPAQPRKPIQSQHEPTNPKRPEQPKIEAPVQQVPAGPGPSPRKRSSKPSDFPGYGWVVIIVAVVAFAYYFGLVVPSNTAKVVPGPTATLRRGVTGVAR